MFIDMWAPKATKLRRSGMEINSTNAGHAFDPKHTTPDGGARLL